MSYTKGPWATDEHRHDVPHQDILIVSQSGRRIAKIWIDDAPVEDYNNEQRANARLIAAAPELLESMENLLRAINYHGEDAADCVEQAEADCRALVSKVKGGAQ